MGRPKSVLNLAGSPGYVVTWVLKSSVGVFYYTFLVLNELQVILHIGVSQKSRQQTMIFRVRIILFQ